jgi:hypothetical protein
LFFSTRIFKFFVDFFYIMSAVVKSA